MLEFDKSGVLRVKRNPRNYNFLFSQLAGIHKYWKMHRDYRIRYAQSFYSNIGGCGNLKSGYYSHAAMLIKEKGKTPTPDHWWSPRLFLNWIMHPEYGNPEVLKDKDLLFPYVDILRTTLDVDSRQNGGVKFINDSRVIGLLPMVTARTIDKYDDPILFKHGWYQTGVGRVKKFPLKYLIPAEFTAFEEACMKKYGYL